MDNNFVNQSVDSGVNNYQIEDNSFTNVNFVNREFDATNQNQIVNVNCTTNTESNNPSESINYEEIDDEFLKVLQQLKGELFYTVLKSYNFNVESLKYVKKSHLDNILPRALYGLQVIFEYNLEQWQKSQGIYLDDKSPLSPSRSGSTLSVSASLEEAVQNLNDFSIEKVLNTTLSGKQILKFFEDNKCLNDNYRKKLANSVTEYLLSNKIIPTPKTFEYIADKIKNYFSSESKDIYYMHKKGKKPGGNLYARYHNSFHQLKKAGVLGKEQIGQKTEALEPESNKEKYTPEENELRDKNWLKYNIEPMEEVRKKWESTFNIRKECLKEASGLSQILDEWPLYKQSFGHSLIDQDFSKLYPGRENSLFEKWACFSEIVLPLMKQKIKDLNSIEILNKLQEGNFQSNIKNNVIAILLHSLLVPTNRKLEFDAGSQKKKLKKFSISDSRNAFFIYKSTHSELKSMIKNLIDINFICKGTIQPIICGIGTDLFDITNYYVYYFETFYKLDNIVKCIDICFKMFNVLDLKYPDECKLVWTFIQNYFYNIHLKNDVKSTSLSALLADIDKHNK